MKNAKPLWFVGILFSLAAVFSLLAQNLSPVIRTWSPPSTRWVTNGYQLQLSDSIIFAWGTNQLITNNLNSVGKMITIIVKNTNGSCVVTSTIGYIFTVPGIGTNQTPSGLQLGPWNSPSNEWTGTFDGQNW